MASFTAGTTFVDGVSNDVTASKLGNLVTNATPTSGFIQDRTAEAVTATNDTLLIGDASDLNNLKRITVANFAQTLPTAKVTTGTIETGTFGTTTSTAATITTGTIPTLVATTLVTTGTGTAAAPAIVPTGDTNTGIFFPAADTIALSEGGAEAMRIDSSGRVGINVTSPLYKLQVDGDAALTDTSSLYWATAGGTTRTSITGDSSGNLKLQTGASNTERLRIDSSGNVGINTTTIDSSLHILQQTATAASGVKIQENASASKYYRLLYTDSSGIFRFNNGSNEATITLAGSFVNASDSRLKKDITDIKYGLNEVMESKPRSFNRVDVAGEYFGFIAQELQNILPEAISGYSESQLGVDYGSLVAVAFRAIQELKFENDSLKSRIEALEAA
jgi:hypothetical protein